MANLCDINLLLAICYDRHEHHLSALEWLNQQDNQEVILCRITQLGLLRLLSNATIMGESVCTMKQAWDIYDAILSDERFIFAPEPEALEKHFREYTSTGQVSPKLWQDAYLAAFARSAKMHVSTFDNGFSQFDGLRVNLLRGK